VSSRAAIITLVCLGLWLTEAVPAFVPTLILWLSIPLLLGDAGPEFSLASVLEWSADPILALFFGGFALSVAASRHGIDARIASIAARLSRGNRIGLLTVTASATSG
jgi:sodium-dependent dicarboxylate transporter 2/3/5